MNIIQVLFSIQPWYRYRYPKQLSVSVHPWYSACQPTERGDVTNEMNLFKLTELSTWPTPERLQRLALKSVSGGGRH